MADPTPPPATGFTVREVARLLRVSKDKILAWVKAGQLRGYNTSPARCAKPRYVILPDDLNKFLLGRQVGPPPKPPRRKRRTTLVDYFAD
jgi:hypothetical protein